MPISKGKFALSDRSEVSDFYRNYVYVISLNNLKGSKNMSVESAIEQKIKEEVLPGDAILELRQQEAVPVLNALKEWMTQQYTEVLPKSPVGQAIAYCLPRWKKLCIYTTNAILQIDNNPVENAIRPIVIGRKNYLFATVQSVLFGGIKIEIDAIAKIGK